ncbi:hypothetical protein AmDm5_3107 [Acetobacter malorum]|uniref:hypothetical protein n=1 Tax=Acetobacter persici TaxID=1076596 RepID=UPI000503EDB0|nr:hypothetical protein [Acetobacter persici]KFL87352.1 hypothetical protein AmDm5_3107 [Acetobacter malorum]MCG0998910.1 hypothetical protein [Acetobacter persici]
MHKVLNNPGFSGQQHSAIVMNYLGQISVASDGLRPAGQIEMLSRRLNADATLAGLKPSSRIFLSGLIDQARITHSLCVSLTGQQCRMLLGLGATAASDARQALVEAGFVERVGNAFDLRPWAIRVLSSANHADVSENGSFSNSIVVQNNTTILNQEVSENEQPTHHPVNLQESPDDAEIRSGLELSQSLCDALTATGINPLTAPLDQVSLAVGNVIEDLLPRHKGGRILWDSALTRHGLTAILGLVAALEDDTVRSPEGWFAAFAYGRGGFAAFEDLRPNLARVKAERLERAGEAEAIRMRAVRQEASTRQKILETSVQSELKAAFAQVSASLDDEMLFQCEKSLRVQVSDNGSVCISAGGLYQNRYADRIKSVAETLASMISFDDVRIATGNILGAKAFI